MIQVLIIEDRSVRVLDVGDRTDAIGTIIVVREIVFTHMMRLEITLENIKNIWGTVIIRYASLKIFYQNLYIFLEIIKGIKIEKLKRNKKSGFFFIFIDKFCYFVSFIFRKFFF
jgi:hypothetical protein